MSTKLGIAVALVAIAAAGCDGEECSEGEMEHAAGVCVSVGVAPGYSGATCTEDEATSGGGEGGPAEACTMAWVCGVDKLRLDCETAGSGYLCHCMENGLDAFHFFSANACGDVTLGFRGQLAAQTCRWPVAWTF